MKASVYFSGLILLAGAGIYLLFSLNGVLMEKEEAGILVIGMITASILGGSFWFYFLEKKKKFSYRRAVLGGAGVVTSAHFLSFYYYIIYMNLCHYFTGGCLDSMGNPPENLLWGLWIALQFTFFSLLFFIGWVTVPSGVLLAMAYLYFRKKAEK